MGVVWDPRKAKLNLARHGVRFSDADGVLYDPDALTLEDPGARAGQRFVSVGFDGLGRILVVVYTYRGCDVRLISARHATL